MSSPNTTVASRILRIVRATGEVEEQPVVIRQDADWDALQQQLQRQDVGRHFIFSLQPYFPPLPVRGARQGGFDAAGVNIIVAHCVRSETKKDDLERETPRMVGGDVVVEQQQKMVTVGSLFCMDCGAIKSLGLLAASSRGMCPCCGSTVERGGSYYCCSECLRLHCCKSCVGNQPI